MVSSGPGGLGFKSGHPWKNQQSRIHKGIPGVQTSGPQKSQTSTKSFFRTMIVDGKSSPNPQSKKQVIIHNQPLMVNWCFPDISGTPFIRESQECNAPGPKTTNWLLAESSKVIQFSQFFLDFKNTPCPWLSVETAQLSSSGGSSTSCNASVQVIFTKLMAGNSTLNPWNNCQNLRICQILEGGRLFTWFWLKPPKH